MHDKIEVFRMSFAMAQHAGARQAVVARNIAHADTPGYRARDIQSFAEAFSATRTGTELRTTRPTHIGAASNAFEPASQVADATTESPNGNTVSLETEMMRATEIRQQHDMALAIYQKSLGVLRTSLGRR